MSVDNGYQSSLQALGIGRIEERVYRSFLRIAAGSLADVTTLTQLSQRRVRQAVADLEAKGLLARSLHQPGEYLPAPPRAAVDTLIARKHDQIESLRIVAEELAAEALSTADPPGEWLELIAAGKGVVNRNHQLLMEAQQEILGLVLPPVVPPDETFTKFKVDLLRRGVRAKLVYQADVLESREVVAFVEAVRPHGEEPRVAAKVPKFLLVVDRRIGFLPAVADRYGPNNDFLVVHPSSLLDALVEMFNAVWERAIPFHAGEAPEGTTSDNSPLSAQERHVLALLTAGMQDVPIAVQLGVTPRTVQRHVRRIMDVLGTKTRFQTGVVACRNGLVGLSGEGIPNSEATR